MAEPILAERVGGSPILRRRQLLGRLIARSLARLEIDGLTRVPPTGAVLLAINHRSLFDGPLCPASATWRCAVAPSSCRWPATAPRR